jgi:long-subunit acyl-CoA synthetase (AMP-forming)/GNAT superfamily N-acetyltransferase
MLPEAHGPALVRLAAAWARPGAPASEDLVAATREAVAAVRPQDLPGAAELVQALLGRLEPAAARRPARAALFALLDAVRRKPFLSALAPDLVEGWTRLLVPAIDRADYTFGELLRSREETDPRTVAIRVPGSGIRDLTVADVGRRTRSLARGLLSLLRDDPEARVAILSENRLEAALVDLACLSNGIVDMPLPANATAEQVVYMLRHSGARVLFAEDEEQVSKVLPSLAQLPALEDIVVFSADAADRHRLLTLEQMADQDGGAFADATRAARAGRVRSRDVATVMYTSGTTGTPKGITFSHLNIVSKRLCRGLALPEVGEGDVFLCYLPLYHTFGRYLELTGTLWWGATYVLARSTATPALLEDFKAVKPTVFISVPKKWMELHDAGVREARAQEAPDPGPYLRALTGGRLRYGLSAAGYLDPEVFKAFQRAGVHLLSGYGMTEATGGILMTARGDYQEGSIGTPLPGIECARDEDGELLVRGPYVTPGYFQDAGGEEAFDAGGWFHTGDLVSVDGRGHYRITGRKKEIYKNRAGQTISPQRIENLFKDFDAVGQAFLVGDRREYNTLLVWPSYDKDPSLRRKTPDELRELISSLVVSANRFLAPFERVVAFRLLPRALDEAHGELTHKQTFKREEVERTWHDLIEPMYQQKRLALPVGDLFLRVPNWVLRELGVLQEEVSLKGGLLAAGSRAMEVGPEPAAPGSMRVGDMAYQPLGGTVDLGVLLARPALWVGNDGIRRFMGEDAFVSLVARRRQGQEEMRIDPRAWRAPPAARLPGLLEQVDRDEVSFHSLQAAGELLRAERPEARRAIASLERTLQSGRPDLARLARALLRRAADSPDEETRRRAFRALLPAEDAGRTLETLRLFLDRLGPYALRDEDLVSFGERGLAEAQVRVLLEALCSESAYAARADTSDGRLLMGAMRLLTVYAEAHAEWYAPVRVPLARLTFHRDERIAARAEEELDRLRRDFSAWIGPNLRRAIDPASGVEYGWGEVVSFDPSVPEAAQELLRRALADTTLMRGSVFLFGRGALVSLADLPVGGARVRLLGTQHGKSVYRLSFQTRGRETFDIAINLAEELSPSALREEIRWLLAAGAPPPLVEAFGGYYPEHGIFTEEFIPGETVERQVARLERQGEARRLKHVWPFLGWNALAAHVDFWDRTGRRVALRHPSLAAFIVPSHDYQTGARLVSIADRSPCAGFEELLDRFQRTFVDSVESTRPELRGGLPDSVFFSAAVEALGLERARPLLEGLAGGPRGAAAEAFLARVRAEGFTPRAAHFAARRYRRWLAVNPGATAEARGAILAELWGTYRLAHLEATWPDVRLRFFRQTVFAGAREELGAALDRLMEAARGLPGSALNLEEQIAPIREALRPTAEEDYFLARLAYRYLRPTDEASLISLPSGEHVVAEVVVALTDEEGERFKVRAPASPREVARLLQLFLDANLLVTFTAEHEFLLALDEDDALLGGLFYRRVGRDRAHMEKIVIARPHQGKGVSGGLMRELVRRLRARAVRALETGYFRPDWFQKYGFRTDPTSGGLVLDIGDEPATRL